MIITAKHIEIYRAAGAWEGFLVSAKRLREYELLRPHCRMWVAEHPSTPAKVLAHLATDKDQYVRRAVAWHPSTPAKVLARMATDADVVVRRRVAAHPSTPAKVLARMATDKDQYVRDWAAAQGVT